MTDNTSLLAAAKIELETKSIEAERIAAAFPVDADGKFSIPTAMYGDYITAVNSAKEAKSFIDSVESMEGISAYLNAVPAPEAALGLTPNGDFEAKSLADVFMQGKSFKSAREGNGPLHQRLENGDRFSGSFEGKSIHALSAGTVTHQSLGNAQHLGITERQLRKTRIRDLFPKSTTNAPVLWGVQETGWVNNAKQVRQRYAADGVSPATGADTDVFGKSPKSKIEMETVLYPVASISHVLDAHKTILDDDGRLRSFLNHRMADGVKYAEDFDLLHSVGSAQEITGLFNVEGVQQYTGEADDKYSVQIRRAITKAQLAEYDPTGVVLSPEMWEQVEVEEDGYGGFRVAVNVAVGAVKQVWHLDVVSTTAMSDAKFLVGSFGLGAQLHDREQVTVTMSTENNDNFERGVVTFRAEERLALEVPRPESFVVGTWTEPTP